MKILRAIASICLITLVVSCGDPSETEQDQTPPVVQFELSVWKRSSDIPMSVAFYIDPRKCSDDQSSSENLEARWDFNNDGIWDTELGPVETFICRTPPVLPEGTWEVKCELHDAGGNVSTGSESLEMPDWTPSSPDIIAGSIRLALNNSEIDSVRVGETLNWYTLRQNWVNEESMVVRYRYYINDEYIGDSSHEAQYCPSHLFCTEWYSISGGLNAPGNYQLRVEMSLEGEIEETDLENNTSTRLIYVYE